MTDRFLFLKLNEKIIRIINMTFTEDLRVHLSKQVDWYALTYRQWDLTLGRFASCHARFGKRSTYELNVGQPVTKQLESFHIRKQAVQNHAGAIHHDLVKALLHPPVH